MDGGESGTYLWRLLHQPVATVEVEGAEPACPSRVVEGVVDMWQRVGVSVAMQGVVVSQPRGLHSSVPGSVLGRTREMVDPGSV